MSRAIIGAEQNHFENIATSGAVDQDYTFDANVVLVSLKFHAGAAPATSENLVVSDAGTGWKFVDRDMAGDADYALIPEVGIPIDAGKTINIAYANTDTNALKIELAWRYER